MNQQYPDQDEQFEHLDADAVCEQCGTVNPEDTLLCKTCGNNLRDQRSRRITGETMPIVGSGVNRIRVFTGLVTTLGIVVVLLAAINVQNIEGWLTEVQTRGEMVSQSVLWSGADGDLLDRMQEDLEARPSSKRQREVALEDPIEDDSYNGRYALAQQSNVGGLQIFGEASLTRRGDKIYFVAAPNFGEAQIRGFAILDEETGRLIADRSVGIRSDGTDSVGFGFAEKLPGGGHTCVGQSTGNQRPLQIWAFRIR